MNLSISLIHFKVMHKDPKRNKHNLLELITRAANDGANIILTPEMSLSGYSFKGREDITNSVEDEDDSFLNQVKEIATLYGCYICIGLALRNKKTDIYFNSAAIIGPENFYLRYDKINAEIRWASPGAPHQSCYFDTPWGRIAVLICSDTYYDLLPRMAAIKGADLLLVPANWPPSGLDPVELWQARALENGMALAACNRTGLDLNMNCETAESCLISSSGKLIFRQNSKESQIFKQTLPLDNGVLNSKIRQERLSNRHPDLYHSCYRNLNLIGELTSFFDLPIPGILSVNCFVPKSPGNPVEYFDSYLTKNNKSSEQQSLWILPSAPYSEKMLTRINQLCQECGIWVLLMNNTLDLTSFLFSPGMQPQSWIIHQRHNSNSMQLPHIDIGPARVALIPYQELWHPEIALASSKDGCDLIVTWAEQFTDETKLICGARTINHLAVAFCANAGAGIWMRPEGHQRWAETITDKGNYCSFNLDTRLTRQKRFQDRVDFDLLFKQ